MDEDMEEQIEEEFEEEVIEQLAPGDEDNVSISLSNDSENKKSNELGKNKMNPNERRAKFAQKLRSQIIQKSTNEVPEEYHHLFDAEEAPATSFRPDKLSTQK